MWGWPHRFYRTMPQEVRVPENNLRIGAMDFPDFATATGDGGIFRGLTGQWAWWLGEDGGGVNLGVLQLSP